MRWAGHVALIRERRVANSVLVGEREGKGQLGRPRLRWEDIFKADFQDVGR